MDLKQIEKLMAAMENSRIKRIVLKREDYEIEIERECALSAESPVLGQIHTQTRAATPHEEKRELSGPAVAVAESKNSGMYVTSPMVGTFYAAPSPEDQDFVKVGDLVSEDTVVCIIEAMKVMNEVKAGMKGVVAEILLKNGEPVEFGTHILRVNPA